MSAKPKTTRCAIYTRKSSEEGLEQDFNSLHAQREACEAYVKSQKHEGWQLLPEYYDDGGFSGGNMERPGLKALMQAIDDNQVDVIVVYKVDRLTRSLADFVKLVEKMDAKGISFVSVTQQFNTTTSMGRLTLNVLLSFAQFEREVTGERIRDKIAMSKQRGQWMGGMTPMGYDCKDHQLFINEADASVIRHIFDRYLALGSINLLTEELKTTDYRTKIRTSKAGREWGDNNFRKAMLPRLLKNRVYIGEIVHKEKSYPGNHEPIISREIFEQVQQRLAENRMRQLGSVGAKSPCLLSGKLFDDRGNYMSPKHSRTRKRHYRYYTSQAIIQGKPDNAGSLPNIPAHEIEHLVTAEIQRFLQDDQRLQPHLTNEPIDQQKLLLNRASHLSFDNADDERLFYHSLISRIVLSDHDITITLAGEVLVPLLQGKYWVEANSEPSMPISLLRNVKLQSARDGSKVVVGSMSVQVNRQLVNAVAKGFLWNQQFTQGEVKGIHEIAKRENVTPTYISRIIRLRFFAPDIIDAIVTGSAPSHWTLEAFFKIKSFDWNEQRRLLGFN